MSITSVNDRISDIYPQKVRPVGKCDKNFADLLTDTDEQVRSRTALLQHLSEDPNTNKYFWRAGDSGTINYRGTVFVVDRERNNLNLGDCTDLRKCLVISLSGGGALVVNRDNLEELKNALPMFSAEDIGRILRAIEKDQLAQEYEFDLEDESADAMMEVVAATDDRPKESNISTDL